MTLIDFCVARTDLNEAELCLLEQMERTLHSIADLVRGDVFIDCVDRSGRAFVAAHAVPQFMPSIYKTEVLGLPALSADEPAVYRTLAEGVPFHDIVASTQEKKTVAQDVTPIKNTLGQVIGVLIAEHDITREIAMERKLEALSDDWNQRNYTVSSGDGLDVRETYHRVKNHLQILSSICNIKARQATQLETRVQLLEVSGMIKSVSSLQTLLGGARQSSAAQVSLQALLELLLRDISSVVGEWGNVKFQLDCPPILLRHDAAVAILVIVNELIANAIEHGFSDAGGVIRLEARQGIRFGTVSLTDNGTGVPSGAAAGTGLTIIQAMVSDRLKGEFYIDSSADGTKAIFSFLL